MLAALPPIPVNPASPVVAGPVLSAGSMWWVEAPQDRLVVRSQDAKGRVRVVAAVPPPPDPPGATVQQYVVSFAVEGRRVAMVDRAIAYPRAPACAPAACYFLSLVPPSPIRYELRRGTVGHVRAVAVSSKALNPPCRIPELVAWSAGRLVSQSCVSRAEPDARIRIESRIVASGAVRLVGARAGWLAYDRSGTVAVRRVRRPHRRYLVRRPSVSDAVLSTGGRLVVRSTSARGADPCAADRETETVDFALAGPGHPGLRPLVSGVTNHSPYAAYGTAVAAGVRRPGCPGTFQTSVFEAGPTTTVGPVTTAPTFALDLDRHEVAVYDNDTALRRYPR